MKFLSTFVLVTLVVISLSQDDSDKFWILIDSASMLPCNGPPNQFNLTKDDVSVKDQNGKTVDVVEAPGKYFIQFDNIKVFKPLPNLEGYIAVLLQVPVVTSSIVNLAFPYQVIPRKTMFDGELCDDESGVVEVTEEKRDYCHYCDLCSTSGHVEKQLANGQMGHKFAPNLGSESEESFSGVCKQIGATTYKLKRSLDIPGKKEMEREANKKKGGVDGLLEQKLKPGKGKLQVFLILKSASNPPLDANKWYSSNNTCACCPKDAAGNSNCKATFWENVQGKPPTVCQKCNNVYAKQCQPSNSERVGCYIVEYNYRLTNNSKDVDAFRQAQEKKKQGQPVKADILAPTVQAQPDAKSQNQNQGAQGQGQAQTSNQQQTSKEAQGQGSGGGKKPCTECDPTACVAAMTNNFKAYCTNAMKYNGTPGKKYCCRQCSSLCAPV